MTSLSEAPLTLSAATTLAAGIVLIAILYHVTYGQRYKGKRLPPGPLFTLPLLGEGMELGLNVEHPVAFFYKRFKRYGPVFRVQLSGTRLTVVNDMAALKGVLRDDGALLDIPFPSFKALMDGGSLFGGSFQHAPWRKLMVGALSGPQMAAMVPGVVGVMRRHLAAWEADGGQLHIFTAARRLGLDLGLDVITHVQLSDKVDRDWFKQQLAVFLDGLYGLPLRLPGSPLARALAAKEVLLEVLGRELEGAYKEFTDKWEACGRDPDKFASEVMAAGAAQGADDGGAEAGGAAPAAANPELSVQLGQFMGRAMVNPLSAREAARSVLHTLVAATDTTRFALFNVWALLALSRRVQDKLHEEQQQVIAEYGEELSYKAACSMPYMDATLKEAMRLLPASAGGMRRLTRDLHVGEYVVPAGEMVWFHAGLLHMTDPALWDGDTTAPVAPHMDWRGGLEGAFRPERWLGGGPRPCNYTFGTGAHLCPGMNLVYLELKLMLSLVMRRYRLRLRCPDMLGRCTRLFPFLMPARGTDTVVLEAREAPAAAA